MQVEIRKLNIDDYDELAETNMKPIEYGVSWSKRNIQKADFNFCGRANLYFGRWKAGCNGVIYHRSV